MDIRSVIPGLTVLVLAACGSSVPVPITASPVAQADGAPAVRVAETVATGLDVPWGIAFLPDGSALVSERDTARILRVTPGTTATAGMVDGVTPRGEGGLLGIAYADGWMYAYFTAADDNRVVRMAWDGAGLGAAEEVLVGIPKAGIHNGGRIAFGPDGMLYIATGDAGDRDAAQDPASPAGKILRVTPDGSIPADNPLPGSAVFSLGHRNIQGLAFDDQNRLWASEFGQSDVDELNLITAGSNYGWPECEGACGKPDYVDPVMEWEPTSIASPSGIAIVGDYAYVASLRGQTVWQVPLDRSGQANRLDLGDLGRLRTIATAPGGSLWLSTSNTDGRGDPRGEDDRILRLTLNPPA
ncbi:PQQ-dependent sugar dehydrogenase [Mycolicibacterium sp.]|uniref:PQQ-dependent sugar dehydrogenase n=1 Tax=Mycolicibacterium sp. TaxID=2320850 RepID=UPI0028A98398|nr:PQQ-dependent sugar dehydrogenase [Mycolicibacterium sp.]